jgi:hypothetical protein
MTLKELFNALAEQLGGRPLSPGEPGNPVKGLAVDEEVEGWLGPDEVVVTNREVLDDKFLAAAAQGGAPAILWRTAREPSEEVAQRAGELGLGLLTLPPDTPLRALLSLLARDAVEERLLRYSHEAARTLVQSADGEASVAKLAGRLANLLHRSVVVEDPVGRLLAGGDPDGVSGVSAALTSTLEDHGLRASKGSGIEETRRERRDRYARLPDGFLSVPVERWRVAETELFWSKSRSATLAQDALVYQPKLVAGAIGRPYIERSPRGLISYSGPPWLASSCAAFFGVGMLCVPWTKTIRRRILSRNSNQHSPVAASLLKNTMQWSPHSPRSGGIPPPP